ncbi:hypothetical protein IWT25_02181 [Secundilactobacillus pentosiphilus]|uniref:Uncharacterized protein n=1 Tax=Secundilactobacillus pentosiphilus TaxID=1714682 RepID=A0A1Z5IYG3_9LACO|nr:host-nuclease inhibitor Gam family protein [Secundilactobacillus pentosiphilus]GAX06834.1 hypothetical protein IWT25_02181 [Secundilactobacillus pentosiphilus]
MDNVKEAEQKERFVIDDDSKANWALRKMAEISAKLDKVNEQKKLLDQQNDQWYERKTKKLNDDWDDFATQLEGYRLKQPNQKIDLPAGKTITRHPKDYQYDNDELVKFVKANHREFIQPIEKFEWGKFKKTIKVHGDKAFDANGELIPGMKVVEQEKTTYYPAKLEGDLNE